MFRAGLYVADNPILIQSTLVGGGKVIVLDESLPAFVQVPGVTLGSILLPPYQAVVAKIDENEQEYVSQYYQYLASPNVDSYICLILLAMYQGTAITLFVPEGSDEFGYTNLLLNYLALYFGLTVGGPHNQFSCDPSFFSMICDKIYMYGLVDGTTYLQMYPPVVPLNQAMINKLILDLNPALPVYTMQSYTTYFNDLKEQIKANGNKPLIRPFERWEPNANNLF